VTRPLRWVGNQLRRVWMSVRFLPRTLLFAPKRFDAEWYLKQNPDVAMSGMHPYKHYILYGKKEGRQPAPDVPMLHRNKSTEFNSFNQAVAEREQAITQEQAQPDRLVSILIVNHNGRHHLPELLSSIAEQTYRNFEIILVDNASSDGSLEMLRSDYPEVKVVALSENVGFAEANNIAAEEAIGDYLLLLNNDMRVETNLLAALVGCLESDPSIGAVGPKIRFWQPFVPIDIYLSTGSAAFLDIEELERSSPSYNKFFFSLGFSEPIMEDGVVVRRLTRTARLWVPADSTRQHLFLRIRAEHAKTSVTIRIGRATSKHALVSTDWIIIDAQVGSDITEPQWILNNAGSEVTSTGIVRDRGFGQPDNGDFDRTEFTTALCGCAMLIRRSVLDDNEPIFAGKLFAYFEDTDLSLRIVRKGYKLAYCPGGVVYHKHASTRGEDSSFFKFYVYRNRILFYALHFDEMFWQAEHERARLELNHLKHYYRSRDCRPSEREFADRIDEIFADWDCFIPQITAGQFYERRRHFPRLAVYNRFWNTLGGGEYRAAVLAKALTSIGPVELIGEEDFSIPTLEEQFNIDLSRCCKIKLSQSQLHDPSTTGRYDVFINSTYHSELVSYAKLSVYIVSFPHELVGREQEARSFLKSYQLFLANSNYTREWCQRYWGVEAETLYPAIQGFAKNIVSVASKKKIILNVGRFFWYGHCKKQLELVKIFQRLYDSGRLGSDWRLVLTGQVQAGHEDYFAVVRKTAEGYPIDIYPNVSRNELDQFYADSAIYWHATGLNEDLNRHPDRAEHFGITTIEAMQHGCVPVVIRAGGQPEIVEEGKQGFLFGNEAELMHKTQLAAAMFENNPAGFAELMSHAQTRASDFTKTDENQNRFLELLDVKIQNTFTDDVTTSIGRNYQL